MSQSTHPPETGNRTLSLVEPFTPDGRAVIRITERKSKNRVESTTYRVVAFPAYDGSAIGLTWEKDDGTTYTTCLDGHGSQCECLGQLRWGHRHPCKHISAGFKLKDLGLLVMPSVEDERQAVAEYA